MDIRSQQLVAQLRAVPDADRCDVLEAMCDRIAGADDIAVLAEVLVAALGDAQPLVRITAAERLGRRDFTQWHDALAKALDEDHDATVRACAAESLGETGGARAAPALRRALEDEDRAVRAFAASSLGRVGDPGDAFALQTIAAQTSEVSLRVALHGAALRLGGDAFDFNEIVNGIRGLATGNEDDAIRGLNEFEELLREPVPNMLVARAAEVVVVIESLLATMPKFHHGQLRRLASQLALVEENRSSSEK